MSGRHSTVPQVKAAPKLNPGDEAAPGSPGTGEAVCPECGGSGRLNGERCPNCRGSGKIVRGIGGG